jgi:energy-coupling factor transporter ATP-binding protein EcfA2
MDSDPGGLARTHAREMVRLEHVSLSYDGMPALVDADFRISYGEFAAVVGPSGCGKSTIMRLVTGLMPPSAGNVFSTVARSADRFAVPAWLFRTPTFFLGAQRFRISLSRSRSSSRSSRRHEARRVCCETGQRLCSRVSALRNSPISFPGNCQGACSSAPTYVAPSFTNQSWSCSTSRLPRSMLSRKKISGAFCRIFGWNESSVLS